MGILSFEEVRPGYQVEQYTLLEQIGHGGQAVVWSGVDDITHSVVAVKLINLEEDDPLLDTHTFDQQAQTVAGLVHPHIVPLYSFGFTGRLRYMVTRYICGGSLEDLLLDGPLPIPEILRLASQIVSALDYIHGLRLAHRDIKPSNVLLDTERNAFLTDFGLARLLSQSTQALHTGRGTPAYSPPEQVLSAPLTLRSDIYTLGVVLYEMFTGQLPWDGMISLASRQLQAGDTLPDPTEVNPALSSRLATVLRAMTAADPDSRPATAAQALNMLHDALDTPLAPGAPIEVPLDATKKQLDMTKLDVTDAANLLKDGLAAQDLAREKVGLPLTSFFCIDAVCSRSAEPPLPLDDRARQFMLRAALAHGHRIEQWWQRLPSLEKRLECCVQTLAFEDEEAVERAVTCLLRPPDSTLKDFVLPPASAERLLALASQGADIAFQMDALDLLGRTAGREGRWQETAFTPAADEKLAQIAMSDGFEAKEAARLIGKSRSLKASQSLTRAWTHDLNPRAFAALLTIQKTAGEFPPSMPLLMRLQLSGQIGLQQLVSGFNHLIPPLLWTMVGSTLGVAFQVYATVRLRGFFAIDRILITIERGLFLGILMGLGIFATRLIVKRFDVVKPIPRLLLGTVIGAAIINISVVLYQLLFLKAAPVGWLIALGSVLIVLGFAVSSLLSRPAWLVRALISFVFAEIGVVLPWLLSIGTGLDPIFHYEYTWPLQQVLFISSIVALCITFVSQLTDVSKAS